MRPALYATARNVESRKVSPLSSLFDNIILVQVHLSVEIQWYHHTQIAVEHSKSRKCWMSKFEAAKG